ncbi:uncharacterized protein LOC123556706 [Mercenaria mercenaria]|uniref:uncharacterized protein LOC123556706 n=1 Tax=Mercenaria mercenaria TaxID=6596 RepID=UPI00234E44CD|nr:uncharacterized protein LOC123556706 [Mercenaria mercenaria]
MFQEPDYVHNVSLKLSDVLDDIGVDERTVLKRRRAYLLMESIDKTDSILVDKIFSVYYLGSLSEGTTTTGLNSDSDRLCCFNKCNMIQDWKDWQPGVLNLLMIQDESVSPGYCLLQSLRADAPLPSICEHVFNECICEVIFFRDMTGRLFMRNSVLCDELASNLGRGIRHGPAFTQGGGVIDTDTVGALHCKSWPLQARQWLDWQGVGQWPSVDMKRYCSNSGCFVVGVGSKGSQNEELEWRISTCFAERCLMFNLNITQIRCYVLMKMILKTYIKPHYEDTISSFMCKTVLLQLTANTQSSFWRENNLLVCLSLCLSVLYNYILNENCPHFIIPGNNLMAGYISFESKPHILEILQYIINSKGTALLEIECDDLGKLLQLKLNTLCLVKIINSVSASLLEATAAIVQCTICKSLISVRNSSDEITIRTLMKYLSKLVILSQCQGLDKTTCSLLAPRFCTTLGSILASQNTGQNNGISEEALTWISLGLNTDVSSGKLKLASVFYCTGDVQKTETVLRDIERCYDPNIVEPVCTCHNYIKQMYR